MKEGEYLEFMIILINRNKDGYIIRRMIQMQIVDIEEIERKKKEKDVMDIKGVKFCIDCGNQVNEKVEKCEVCKGGDFIGGKFAWRLAGYLQLYEKRLLKKYYNKMIKKKSAVRMNDKRVMLYLMVKDGLVEAGNKEMESVLYRCM